MTRLLIFLLLVVFQSACTVDPIKDKDLQITIQLSQSYKYDLKTGTFTVFYMSKPPTEIKFNLSNNERCQIVEKYYSLGIDKIKHIDKVTGNTYIEDKCMIMPKTYYFLHIKTKKATHTIQIDSDCQDFPLSNYMKARKINKFLDFVFNLLNSKPELRNKPHSDIIYL